MPVMPPIADVDEPGSPEASWTAAQTETRRTLRLTPRWTILKEHATQSAYFWHPARFKVNPSGRRSGKTELAKRKGVLKLVQPNKRGLPQSILYAAPTHDQAKMIFWDDLKALIPRHWIDKCNETLLIIKTKWGAQLRVMGFDRPQRMEGTPWDHVFIDELADCRPRCFELNVLPALSTLGMEGGADLLGVPDETGANQAEYEDLYEKGLLWPNRFGICSFHWSSADILDPVEIANMKANMDEFAFRQEFGGQFIRSGGKAIPKFNTADHVNAFYAEYTSRLPLDWTLDFGTNVSASLLCQTYRGQVWVMDELYLRDSSTETATREFVDRITAAGYSRRIFRIFGDAAGRSPQSNIGTSDYEIIGTILRGQNIEWNNLRFNPLVKDTVNAVRSRMVNSDNEVNLFIHPRCTHLIEDLKTAPWPSDLRQYHALAALRYYCYSLFGRPTVQYQTSHLGLPTFRASS
jgi:hypothetical protein